MKLKYIIISLLLLGSNNVFAQIIILRGKIIDKKNNLILSGVTIKSGTEATISDQNGSFTLRAQLRTLTEKGMNFSLVGYLSMRLIYEPNHFYEVELAENTIQLNEVIIGATGEDIVKKAIRKIPDNYPDKPIVIKGVLRTQSWRNKSEYFKSDAIIKAYIPPYGESEKSTVAVLQNRLDTIKDRTLRHLSRVGFYNLIDFQDIAHNRFILNKISKKRKFDYLLVGKQVFNNHKVFVINTILKDTSKVYDKIDATLYIDTASYAFVAANIFIHNWVQPGSLTKKITNYRVSYEKIGEKWYLQETHYVGESEYRTQSPRTIVDFIRTEIDSIDVDKIPYKDIIQKSEDIQLVDRRVSDEKWAENDELFRMAESDGRLTILPASTLDTIRENNAKSNPPNQKIRKPFGVSILDYITKDNVRSVFGLTKSSLLISSLLYTVPESVNYGLTFGGNFRVYKNLFFGYQGSSNFWNKKHINLRTTALSLSNEFVFYRTSRSMIVAPYIGYEFTNINYDKSEINYNTLNYGLKICYELTHKKALFLSSGLNSGLSTSTLKELIIIPTDYAVALGIVFKL